MCTLRPCKCSCELFQAANIDAVLSGPAGGFCIRMVQEQGQSVPFLWVKLPCEGGDMHGLPLAHMQGRAHWQWDGNSQRPTLTPSIQSWRTNSVTGAREEIWHGFIRDGRAVSC